jgi:hypothetical protein
MGDQNVSMQIDFWSCSRLSCNVTIYICLSMAITSCYIIYAWFWCHRCKAVNWLTRESVCNHEHHWNWGKISWPVLSWEDAIWTVAMGWLQRKFLSFFSVSRDALKQKKWVSCSSPGFLLWIIIKLHQETWKYVTNQSLCCNLYGTVWFISDNILTWWTCFSNWVCHKSSWQQRVVVQP